MDKNKTVLINGRKYDARTGLPVDTRSRGATPTRTHSSTIHASTQRTRTLARRVTKKPVANTNAAGKKRQPGQVMDVARSPRISRFHTETITPQPVAKKIEKPTAPVRPHPVVMQARAKQAPAISPNVPKKTSAQVKKEAVSAALAKPSAPKELPKKPSKLRRTLLIVSSALLILIALGVVTYINMPSLSVQVASLQAGVDATYPKYRPDGYRIDGPITYNDGEVIMNFKSNTGDSHYTVTQSKSTWDSSAVLDNIVRPKAGEQYLTSQEKGLTIYTYNGNAAWVNGGVLYVIDGDAPLSNEQLRRIATSL